MPKNIKGKVTEISQEITRPSGFRLKVMKLQTGKDKIPVQIHTGFYRTFSSVKVGDEINVAVELNQYGKTDAVNLVAVSLKTPRNNGNR